MKIVKISKEDFELLIEELDSLKIQVKELQKANSFLNMQIEDYNSKFPNHNTKKERRK